MFSRSATHISIQQAVLTIYQGWLENVLTSRLMDPVKALSRAKLFGNVGSKFDIDAETLDDQWTARAHKLERRWMIEDLQELAAVKSVRVTILRYVLKFS